MRIERLPVSALRLAMGLLMLAVAACATAPTSPSGRQDLDRRADATLQQMRMRDPGLDEVLRTSAGFAVFPEIGKGGAIVGGAYGQGVLYQQGRKVGYVSLSQASIGAQLGGQTFAELIVLRDMNALNRVKSGQFSLGADASAVALTAGAAAGTTFRNGVAVFTLPRGGLMAELSVRGQRLNFVPAG